LLQFCAAIFLQQFSRRHFRHVFPARAEGIVEGASRQADEGGNLLDGVIGVFPQVAGELDFRGAAPASPETHQAVADRGAPSPRAAPPLSAAYRGTAAADAPPRRLPTPPVRSGGRAPPRGMPTIPAARSSSPPDLTDLMLSRIRAQLELLLAGDRGFQLALGHFEAGLRRSTRYPRMEIRGGCLRCRQAQLERLGLVARRADQGGSMSGRGGRREGAGRPRGSKSRRTIAKSEDPFSHSSRR
jgi:hypothetical protein